jgi:predicted dehydrogenase
MIPGRIELLFPIDSIMRSPRSSSNGDTRRDFLKKGAIAAAALAASPNLFRQDVHAMTPADPMPAAAAGGVVGANERIRVGFIGVGGQGFGTHVRTVAQHAEAWNVQGVAVCDVFKKRVDRSLRHLGLSEQDGYEDYRYLLERDDIDAIYVGSVDHWHARMAIDAMEAGKHVFVEKPMTRYLEEAFQLHDAVKRTGKVFQLGTHYTSEGHWHRAGQLVREGKIGPLVLAQTSFCRNNPEGEWNYTIDPDTAPDTVNWKLWLGPLADRTFSADEYHRWRKYYPFCSGIMGDLLSHKLHPLMIATDTRAFPRRVACIGTRYITPDRDVPETTQFITEFPNGLQMLIMGSTVNEEGLREIIRGHRATLYLGGNQVELRPERPFADEIDREEHRTIPNENHHKNWFDSIRSGKPPHSDIDLAIRGQTIVSMAEMSERYGQMLYFDEATRRVTDAKGAPVPLLSYENDGLA